jgi:hypothetical protein
VDPSAYRVADRFRERQASLEIEAARKTLIPLTVHWKPAGRPVTIEDEARSSLSAAAFKDWQRENVQEARVGTIRGVLGVEVANRRYWLALELPIVADEDVVTSGPLFGAHEVRFIRGSDKPFRTEPELAEAVVYLLASQGSLDRPMRFRTKALAWESWGGALKVRVGKGLWQWKPGKGHTAPHIRPRPSPWAERLVDTLAVEWKREHDPEPLLTPAWEI